MIFGIAVAMAVMNLTPVNAFAASAPPEAAQVGYATNTFSSTFTGTTVDLKNTKNRGFKWYLWDLFVPHANPADVVLNSDGTATLLGGSGENALLVTAVAYNATNAFAGTAFGGGAYIEAEMKFDPKNGAAAAAAHIWGWPAFWAMQIEGNLVGSNQWPGQSPDYVHSIETDFFEGMHISPQPKSPGYGGAMHDWYGVRDKTCANLCTVNMPFSEGFRVVPAGTDFTQFHRYGFLWVPATKTSAGYAKFYFDDQQLGPAHEWQLYTDQPPPAANQPWAYGVLDQRHMFLIIGTGRTQPLTVRSVNVWQRNGASNLGD